MLGVQMWVGISVLRWNGTPDDVVLRVLRASVEDADKATAGAAARGGISA